MSLLARSAHVVLGPRHRLAPLASAIALLVLIGLGVLDAGERAAAAEIEANVRAIEKAVRAHHGANGRYFPAGWQVRQDGSLGVMELFPDPFAEAPSAYGGLDPELFAREANHGIVLQLVRFDAARDLGAGPGLLTPPLRAGDPYLRFLLDYGSGQRQEAELLERVVDRLGVARFTRVEEHLYVMDLRSGV